jgi:sugar O-acyltransferase (sialic acid O-acetyltransferase NeuD family)
MGEKNHELEKIVIIGAGGQGEDVLWTIMDINKISSRFDIVGFLDDDKGLHGKIINGIPILGGINWLSNKKKIGCVIAVGDGKIREKIVKKLKGIDVDFPSIIHPTVIISDFVTIGKGTIIHAGAIIPPNSEIGDFVFINLRSQIGHDCKIKDFVSIMAGVNVTGDTTIENGAYLASGVTVADDIKIGEWSIVGLGSVIGNDVKPYSLYLGNPGIFIRQIKDEKSRPKL